MNFIKGFDGLRAVSIVFVLLGHLGLFSHIPDNSFLKENYYLFSGPTGVMIFFSISGFLITSLLLKEKEANGKINFKYFFIRRSLRLLPPLIIFCAAIFLLMLFDFISPNYKAIIFSFFYLYNFVPFRYYTEELAHTWSLGVEEQFYLFWPFVLSFCGNIKNSIWFSMFLIFCCSIWKPGIYLIMKYVLKTNYLTEHFFLDRWFIPACLPIIIGSLVSLVLFVKRPSLELLIYKNWIFLVLAFTLFVIKIFIPQLNVFVINLLQPLGISLFLLWIYFNQDSFLVKVLEIKPISFLGKISYGVYVYQGLFLRSGPGGNLKIQQFPLNICLVFITAIISYYFLEKKIMKFKKKFKAKETDQIILTPVGEIV